MGSQERAKESPRRNPAMPLSLQGSNSSPLKHHGVVTKTQSNDRCDGRLARGQRLREVSEMGWTEINLDAKLWTLPGKRAKNDVQHEIPMPDLAIDLLTALPRIDGSQFVFTISGRNRSAALIW
jgi:integrase